MLLLKLMDTPYDLHYHDKQTMHNIIICHTDVIQNLFPYMSIRTVSMSEAYTSGALSIHT